MTILVMLRIHCCRLEIRTVLFASGALKILARNMTSSTSLGHESSANDISVSVTEQPQYCRKFVMIALVISDIFVSTSSNWNKNNSN